MWCHHFHPNFLLYVWHFLIFVHLATCQLLPSRWHHLVLKSYAVTSFRTRTQIDSSIKGMICGSTRATMHRNDLCARPKIILTYRRVCKDDDTSKWSVSLPRRRYVEGIYMVECGVRWLICSFTTTTCYLAEDSPRIHCYQLLLRNLEVFSFIT